MLILKHNFLGLKLGSLSWNNWEVQSLIKNLYFFSLPKNKMKKFKLKQKEQLKGV